MNRTGKVAVGTCLLIAVLLGLTTSARCQEAEVRKGIQFDVTVNYGYAYRADTWVPVDVFVKNNDVDVSGPLELRFYVQSVQEGPTYVLPAECPRGSVKRFRFTCCPKQANILEVMLYNGKRRAVEFPFRRAIAPIGKDDLLGLLLTEDPLDYGFLTKAVTGETIKRFHRECLNDKMLDFLSDRLQCYDAVDVVVLGSVDPNRIGARSREVLTEYVRRGGVLVVCLGDNAKMYKGSWVEDLLGAEIGSDELVWESELIVDVFPGEAGVGARADRQIVFTEITPKNPTVKVRGGDRIISTINELGSGRVVGVAVDASSRAFQSCDGYLNMWRTICLLREAGGGVDYDGTANYCANSIPTLSGVSIYSRGSVFVYLALYISIGIIGNWLFWNRRKRRELAWLTMIFFSICFTLYAAIFGTVGRAKASELEQVDIMHVPLEGGNSRVVSIFGILTARSAGYTIELPDKGCIVRQSSDVFVQDYYGGMGGSGVKDVFGERPFVFVGGEKPKIEQFSVGASSMRLAHVESERIAPGGIVGALKIDEEGVRGSLKNETGCSIESAYLYCDGRVFMLNPTSDGWAAGSRTVELNDPYYSYRGNRVNIGDFKKYFVGRALKLNQDEQWQESGLLDPSAPKGPFVFGWCKGSTMVDIRVPGIDKRHISETFIVADVNLEREYREGDRSADLPVMYSGGNRMPVWSPDMGNFSENARQLVGGVKATERVTISVPPAFAGLPDTEVTVTLYSAPQPGYTFHWKMEGRDEIWSESRLTSRGTVEVAGETVTVARYKVPVKDIGFVGGPYGGVGMRPGYGPQSGVPYAMGNGVIYLKFDGEEAPHFTGQYILSAEVPKAGRKIDQGELNLWQ